MGRQTLSVWLRSEERREMVLIRELKGCEAGSRLKGRSKHHRDCWHEKGELLEFAKQNRCCNFWCCPYEGGDVQQAGPWVNCY